MRISGFLPLGLLLIFSSLSHGQATATFTASVTIIQPIEITTTSHMNFAHLDAQQGGEVVLTPNNLRKATGGVILSEGGVVSAAAFKVTGEPGLSFDISLPDSQHTLSNGSENIVIRDFVSSMSGIANLGSGTKEFSVGATLDIEAGQAPGLYSSTEAFEVTVNYN